MSSKLLIPANWSLPKTILERLGEQIGRQRAMFADGHLLLLLHALPDAAVPERQGILFWRKPDGTWEVNERGRGIVRLKEHIASYQTKVDELEALYDQAKNSTDFFTILDQVSPLARAAVNMLSALQEARENVKIREMIVLRDLAIDVERASTLLREECNNALNHAIARQGEVQARSNHEMARASHRLNTLIALFLPLTALGSVFGMNLPSGLERQPIWLFWAVFGFGLTVGFLVRGTVGTSEEA